MKKKFKSRRHKKIKYISFFLTILLLILLSIFLKLFINLKLINIDVISLLNNMNIFNKIDITSNITNHFFSICRFDINKPNSIIQSITFYETPNNYKYHYIKNKTNNIAETTKENQITQTPQVYIYNTHDTEEYSDNYGVYDASFYLKEKLQNNGINSIVEENKTSTLRNSNNWNYNLSYKASRINLEKIKNENPNIKLFIDLHRDSVGKKLTTITIGDKIYAKTLFVIGREHENYLENLHYTQSIDSIINSNYPGLSKGILEKEGPGVNGIYNQDIGYNVILLEVGGNENNSQEVKNTLNAIAGIIKEKLNEEN